MNNLDNLVEKNAEELIELRRSYQLGPARI